MIKLSNVDPAVFEIVSTWLYTKKLTEEIEGKDVECRLKETVPLFIFGQKFGMPALCNDIIDLIITYGEKEALSTFYILRVYKDTALGSPLRRVVVATYVHYFQGENDLATFLDKKATVLLRCPEFLLDLTKAFSLDEGKAKNSSLAHNRCQHHQHAGGEEKCS